MENIFQMLFWGIVRNVEPDVLKKELRKRIKKITINDNRFAKQMKKLSDKIGK